ncbi:MAG: cytochrome-c peroxidase [Rhodothermales bacterium]
MSGLASVIVTSLLIAGYSSQVDVASNDDFYDSALNVLLTERITLNGQRRLQNFVLPESDDFSSIPQDPRNPLTADKVTLGRFLFHDAALSQAARHTHNLGTYSCATCHHAAAGFEAGAARSIGEGGIGWGTRGEARRPDPSLPGADVDSPGLKSQTILNKTYQRLMMYSGAAGTGGDNEGLDDRWIHHPDAAANHLGYQGMESQAIGALSKHRLFEPEAASQLIRSHPTYAALWESVWAGNSVTTERMGLSIAAYERTVMANRSPFQQWLKGDLDVMSREEKRGAMVFFGDKSECTVCHTGPALSSMAFYALGMPDMPGVSPDPGRGGLTGEDRDRFTYKVPQLYNLTDAGFMGHGSSFRTMREIVDYYVEGVPAISLPPDRFPDQFRRLDLTEQEIEDLIVFLETALRDPDLERYQPTSVPSGACIPANDPLARHQLAC